MKSNTNNFNQKFLNKFKNKRVLITGHTGFKGSWLTLWLSICGAKILGISDKVHTNPSLFKLLDLKRLIKDKRIDITNYKKFENEILSFKPEYIFHLAAQPLVMQAYKSPMQTFKTNTVGTLNLLNIINKINYNLVTIFVTSDKVYENREIKKGYKEDDILGGSDPYSASKSMAELAINSYFKSYLYKKKNIRIGIVRAGNVVGGGDWSNDRIIPDLMKSWHKKRRLVIRNPYATRPWQHVIDPLCGYLMLSYNLSFSNKLNGESFNFGPDTKNIVTVKNLISRFAHLWPGSKWKIITNNKYHESTLLYLNCNKSKKLLKWKPVLNIKQTIEFTFDWYKLYFDNNTKKLKPFMINQLNQYLNLKKNVK